MIIYDYQWLSMGIWLSMVINGYQSMVIDGYLWVLLGIDDYQNSTLWYSNMALNIPPFIDVLLTYQPPLSLGIVQPAMFDCLIIGGYLKFE
jgi:hypothetical protein